MNSYAYNNFNETYQPQTQPLQQQSQLNLYRAEVIVPLDIDNNQQQKGITNKNLFMFEITIIYIVQYCIQLSLCYGILTFGSQFLDLLTIPQQRMLILMVFILVIVIPIIVPFVKQLRHNPFSLIVSMIYLFVYSCLQAMFASLIGTIGSEGAFAFLGLFGTLGLYSILFNIIGIVLLVVLLIMLRVTGDSFQFNHFQFIGVVLSILIAFGIGSYTNHLFMVCALFAGPLFTFTFSSALDKISISGLRQDQAMFGSFAVYIMMILPCVNKV